MNHISFSSEKSRGIDWKWLEKKISTRKKVFVEKTKNHLLSFYPIKIEFLDRIFFQMGVFDHGESESSIKNIDCPTGNGSKISFSRKKFPNFSKFKKIFRP